jgi:predicted secreted protein
MSWFVAVAMYVVIWWLTIFAVLPLGVKPAEKGDIGAGAGAPANPRLWYKVGITSIVAAVLWVIMFGVIHFGLVDLRSLNPS